MAFDGVPIGISDGLPERRRFCLGRYRVLGCPAWRTRWVWSGCFGDISGSGVSIGTHQAETSAHTSKAEGVWENRM